MFLKGTDFENGQNQASKSNEIWGLSSAHFIFGKPTRKQQIMVKLQLAANAIAKSRSQIRPKPVKDLPINTIFIFSMAGASRRIFIAHSWNVEVIIKMQYNANYVRMGKEKK